MDTPAADRITELERALEHERLQRRALEDRTLLAEKSARDGWAFAKSLMARQSGPPRT